MAFKKPPVHIQTKLPAEKLNSIIQEANLATDIVKYLLIKGEIIKQATGLQILRDHSSKNSEVITFEVRKMGRKTALQRGTFEQCADYIIRAFFGYTISAIPAKPRKKRK